MSSDDANQGKLRVLVVGGGVTALETLLALARARAASASR